MGEQKLSLRRRLALEAYRVMKHQSVKEHRLRQLFWECTLRCNLNCRPCGSDCRSEAMQKDMPLDDFLAVLDQITPHVNPHEVFVIISGGEPLMRSDLERCGRAIYERGFPWGMVTNGLAMTEKRYRALRAAGMHTATVSLDGLPTEHNYMRGHARSFEKATDAIRMMGSDKGFIFDVVTCVNRRNLSQLDEVKEFIQTQGGFAKTMWCGELDCELKMKEEAGMSSRCMPFAQEHLGDVCPICGKPAKTMIYWGVAY